jgi:tripeptide aminopeptidase
VFQSWTRSEGCIFCPCMRMATSEIMVASAVHCQREDAPMNIVELLARPAAAAALRAAPQRADRTVHDMLAIVEIPAPSFEERDRADWLDARWRQAGFPRPERDAVGNVITQYGSGGAPVIVAAHLDTVFPRETPLAVRRDNGTITAPGIADNARGVAVMLAVAELLADAAIATTRPILFVGSVGEEGAGDLHGMKHLFREGGGLDNVHAFIAIDGSGIRRIIHRAVGARRLRCTLRGPGGHSWADRGGPNALHAAADAMTRIARTTLPPDVPASLTVARAAGGISINAIPAEAWFEVDARSESASHLADLEAAVRAALDSVVAETEPGALSCAIEIIGDRPAGATPLEHPLVAAAVAATEHVGHPAELAASSTDANVPMARGVPAVAIGGGGESGGTHTPGEWYHDRDGAAGVVRALLTVLLAAGME